MKLLNDLQLCSQQQISACEPKVRRLCHDLPDFDSVWLDALAQHRILTPWQVDVLQSSAPHRLRVDEFILQDTLGTDTLLAVSSINQRKAVLRKLSTDGDIDRFQTRLVDLLERIDEVRNSAPATLELPRRLIDREDDTFYLASGFVPGWSADELLIRGGRIPWKVVGEIGLQLLTAMRWLEANQLRHGHITLRNVQLQPNGQARLVAPFAHSLQHPTLSYSAELKLKDIETTAPELVASGATHDSQSELYSLGCVLWQMLTSRSTFLAADPVNRLLKAKEKDVADVRTLVPDCPDGLARLIQNFTRRSPELRPASIAEACDRWAKVTARSVSSSRQLLKRMPDRLHQKNSSAQKHRSTNRLRPVAAAAVMVAAFAGYGIHRGLLPMPLRLGGHSTANNSAIDVVAPPQSGEEVLAANAASVETQQRTALGYLPMPTPDAAGVVVLQSGETYEASELEFAGVMHVESTANELAVVKVPNGTPWTIKAAQVALNGIQILNVASDNETPAAARDALVDFHCDVLSMRKCIVRSPADDVLLRWTPLNNATSVVSIQNSVLHGGRTGVWLTSPTKRCTVKNSLFKDVSAIRCDIGDQASTSVRFDISHVTQVGGHGFVDIVSSAQRPTESRIEIECGESVLAPKVALVRLAGGDGWSSANSQVAFLLPERGNPTIVPPDVDPAVYFDRSLNQLVALPENQVVAESILFAAPVFRTPAAGEDPLLGFQLVDYEGPKLSLRLPGADVTALPQFILDESSHGIEDKVPTARR